MMSKPQTPAPSAPAAATAPSKPKITPEQRAADAAELAATLAAVAVDVAPVPATTARTVTANPFLAPVAAMAADIDPDTKRSRNARSITVPNKQLEKVSRLLVAAGNAAKVSVRQQREAVADKDETRVVFYAVPPITRPRAAAGTDTPKA